MKQRERVLEYIDKHGSITNWQALVDVGVGSLSKCISDMVRDGIGIKKEIVCTKNRYGEPSHHTVYRRA